MNVLERTESIDGYRKACNNSRPNSIARQNYKYELATISQKAETFLIEAVRSIPLLKGVEIVILDSSADSGFPHTRPYNYLCLPAYMCAEAPATETFKTTLIHEGIHIHQRKFKTVWEPFFMAVGWTPIEREQIPDKFLKLLRLNPDTIGVPLYAFNKYHVPLPLFSESTTPSFQTVQVGWYDIRAGVLFHHPPKEFIKKYGNNINQPEHPYEIYAELFSDAGLRTVDQVLDALANI
jgi:hypothetical protein